ncbi:hypothetical protein [Streptomyces sp. NPDC029674]|uniref:hypothetical protein n=1 Tax=Streptomyces sp. NPDC029674 TaxID=3365297 RepID=UPI00384B5F61
MATDEDCEDYRESAGAGRSAPETAHSVPAEPVAECVLCRELTEYPESHRGSTLCPACEWLEAQRSACSG